MAKVALYDQMRAAPSGAPTMWVPPTQPPANGGPGSFADPDWTFTQFIQLWDALAAAAPGYILKGGTNTDQSGLFPIPHYTFSPKDEAGIERPEKTLVIQCMIHGSELAGMFGVYRFLYHVVHDWEKYSQLSFIKNRVKLVVIPIANPWGASQTPKTILNSRGVNANLNFDFRWTQYAPGEEAQGIPNGYRTSQKGSAPWSEAESRNTRDIILANPGAIAFLDFHSLGVGNTDSKLPLFTPKSQTVRQDIYRKIMNHIDPDAPVYWVMVDWPIADNWAATKNMHTATIEWREGGFSGAVDQEPFDSLEMTKLVSWVGNAILQAAQFDGTPREYEVTQPQVFSTVFNQGGSEAQAINVPTTGSAAAPPVIADLSSEFHAPLPGIVEMTLVGRIATPDGVPANIVLRPVVGQAFSDFPVEGTPEFEMYDPGGADHYFVLVATANVQPSSDVPNATGPVVFGLAAFADIGGVKLTRVRATVRYTPSDRGDRVVLLSATNRIDPTLRTDEDGNLDPTAPAMQRIYPAA